MRKFLALLAALLLSFAGASTAWAADDESAAPDTEVTDVASPMALGAPMPASDDEATEGEDEAAAEGDDVPMVTTSQNDGSVNNKSALPASEESTEGGNSNAVLLLGFGALGAAVATYAVSRRKRNHAA